MYYLVIHDQIKYKSYDELYFHFELKGIVQTNPELWQRLRDWRVKERDIETLTGGKGVRHVQTSEESGRPTWK